MHTNFRRKIVLGKAQSDATYYKPFHHQPEQDIKLMRILVTGAAGFIGYHACLALSRAGHTVIGIDNLNDYYSPELKYARLNQLKSEKCFLFHKMDMADQKAISGLFDQERFTHVLNLAAQAGVRYSLSNPAAYVHSNIQGFLNILEGCRNTKVQHLVFASSSSVYGLNTRMPLCTTHPADHPVSLYAATKKANEVMAHSYSHLYALPTTGLRFFTVYGPWGRPDMALFIFTRAILENKPVPLFNHGKMQRDFTYIDDIIEGVVNILPLAPRTNPRWDPLDPDPGVSGAPFRLFNIGNNRPVELLHFVKVLEAALGKRAIIESLPMQAGDIASTCADISPLQMLIGYSPKTQIEEGIPHFVEWYKRFYHSA